MRACLMLLAVVSCTRPNPHFMPATATASASSGELEPTASSEPVPTTSSSTSSSQGASSTQQDSTGAVLPECSLSSQRVLFDPALPQPLCESELVVSIATSMLGDTPTAKLCEKADCTGTCTAEFPLDPDIVPLLTIGQCYRIVHQGRWAPGDPETATSCKTSAVAIFPQGETVYPLYAGFSRSLSLPKTFLEPTVAIAPTIRASTRCDCTAADCCADGHAETYVLDFTGAAAFTLAPGETAIQTLADKSYVVTLLRAHRSGAFDAQMTCDADPELELIDWQMFLPPP